MLWDTMESAFPSKPIHNEATHTFESVWCRHNGVGRAVPPVESTHGGTIKVYRTVRMRMQGTYENGPEKANWYLPKARVGWQQDFKDKTPFEQVPGMDAVRWVS
jgi:hypothetical protein